MPNEFEERSEWNEQKLFSFQFFRYNDACRKAQLQNNPVEWWKLIDVKLSAVVGIFKFEDKNLKLLLTRREQINSQVMSFLHLPKTSPVMNKRLSILYEKIFQYEMTLDQMINEKMPFLRLRPREDTMEDLAEALGIED